jgi:hypothetical protein
MSEMSGKLGKSGNSGMEGEHADKNGSEITIKVNLFICRFLI